MQRFSINDDDIVFEAYQDETVLLNLKTGTYYTLDRVGASFLQAMLSSSSLERAEEILVDHYDEAVDKVRSYLHEFVEELRGEELIMPVEASSTGDEAAVEMTNWPTSLTLPKMEKYSDVEDLLLIDPVHEVKEEGWPEPQDL